VFGVQRSDLRARPGWPSIVAACRLRCYWASLRVLCSDSFLNTEHSTPQRPQVHPGKQAPRTTEHRSPLKKSRSTTTGPFSKITRAPLCVVNTRRYPRIASVLLLDLNKNVSVVATKHFFNGLLGLTRTRNTQTLQFTPHWPKASHPRRASRIPAPPRRHPSASFRPRRARLTIERVRCRAV